MYAKIKFNINMTGAESQYQFINFDEQDMKDLKGLKGFNYVSHSLEDISAILDRVLNRRAAEPILPHRDIDDQPFINEDGFLPGIEPDRTIPIVENLIDSIENGLYNIIELNDPEEEQTIAVPLSCFYNPLDFDPLYPPAVRTILDSTLVVTFHKKHPRPLAEMTVSTEGIVVPDTLSILRGEVGYFVFTEHSEHHGHIDKGRVRSDHALLNPTHTLLKGAINALFDSIATFANGDNIILSDMHLAINRAAAQKFWPKEKKNEI